MIPSSAEVADNIRHVVEGLAEQIAVGVAHELGAMPDGDVARLVRKQATRVLLLWFLGDLLPDERRRP